MEAHSTREFGAKEKVRINKFLAERGIASRRAVDELISKGRISVNGIVAMPGMKVGRADTIAIDGKPIGHAQQKRICILLNKPLDCITTSRDTHGRRTVLDVVRVPDRIFPVGRLDKDTTGVLLLTNDGELAHRLAHPRHGIDKIYRAHVNAPLTRDAKKRFEDGMMLDGRQTAPCTVRILPGDRQTVEITLHEGRNRQIHRMFRALGYRVEALDRIRYASLGVGRLQRGQWRFLAPREMRALEKI